MKEIKKRFIIGEDWLYYKIYLGVVTSDEVLDQIILPVATTLCKEEIIDKWFFIRYSDPEHHLRVRFHFDDLSKLNMVTSKLLPYLNDYINKGLIKKVEIGTYQRELKRYGTNSIVFAEEIFCHDSILIIKLISYVRYQNDENLRWLFSLFLIDNFLNKFNYSLEDKKNLLELLKNGYGNEFGMNSYLRKQLSNKYRANRKSINDYINLTNDSKVHPDIQEVVNVFNINISPIVQEISQLNLNNQLQISINNLISSFIHMTMNRLFQSKNRMHEMVCYDFLFRYYESNYARFNSKKD